MFGDLALDDELVGANDIVSDQVIESAPMTPQSRSLFAGYTATEPSVPRLQALHGNKMETTGCNQAKMRACRTCRKRFDLADSAAT
jgi:hypothetical protein